MKLQSALVAIAFSLFTAAVPAAEADPPGVIGRLNHVAGAVSFAPAQAPEDWTAATLNRPITTGDRLWTDSGGRAEMHVGSLATRMDAETSLDVLKLDDSGLQLRLAQGSANLRVRRGSDQPVEIATPGGAVVLTRPGSYRVNVDSRDSATSVTVRAGGQAEVFAQNGSYVVSDGQQAVIAGPRQDLAAAPAPDEFDRWAGTRDQREDRVASTRYVPAEMTGYEDLDQYGTWRTVPQYGTVWRPAAVPAGWAPYRYGHWVWVAPWGWTWVDDAPWGFAPSHYGRWVWLGNHWAWAPGRIVARPVYAPALVAFIGGANFSVSIGVGSAPAVGWVPLGWREPYRPWYRASHAHVRNVNVTHVTNITNNGTNARLVNRSAPSAVTVVSRENFVAARAVQRAAVRVPARTLATAPVTGGSPVAAPERTSLAQARAGARPPAEVRTREAVAVSAPPAPARAALRDGRNGSGARNAADSERPRVRVVSRQERVNPAQGDAQRAAVQAPQANPQGKAAASPERPAEKIQAPAGVQERRRAAAPPAEVTSRPTFDRSQRQVAPGAVGAAATEPARGEQQAGRADRREVQQEQQRARDAQAREQQAQQRAQEQGQRQQRAQEQVQQRAQQQAQPRAQEQAQRQQQAQGEARQRAEQQAQQRTQEQAQRQQQQAQQRAQEQAQRQQQQAQQRAQEQAQRQQQQAQQRAQEQAQRQQQQAQQRAQEQAQRQQQQVQQRAQEQAQRQQQQAQQRNQEKSGRERARQDKSEKG